MNCLKIAASAIALSALALACTAAPDSEENQTSVAADETEAQRLPGAVIGPGGGIITVTPGTNDPPRVPANCPGTCYPAGDGYSCICPHGFTVKTGLVCPYGYSFVCFNNVCSCK